MPARIYGTIHGAANLPIMDKASQSTEAYINLSFGDFNYKTSSVRHSLSPEWEESFSFEETDDQVLQTAPLLLHVLDRDYISADDTVGTVVIMLNTILGYSHEQNEREIKGWFPIFDSLNGVQGHLHLTLGLSYVGNYNTTRGSSAGVSVFTTDVLPLSLRLKRVIQRVDAAVVCNDPEYSFVSTFRTARTSNQARTLRIEEKLAEARRILGFKARELGGNAILHYTSDIDVEGDSTDQIAVRVSGTAVQVAPAQDGQLGPPNLSVALVEDEDTRISPVATVSRDVASLNILLQLTARRFKHNGVVLLSMVELPPFSIAHLGGMLSARAVHVLKDSTDEATRADWWEGVRHEMTDSAARLNCNAVIGYCETQCSHGGIVIISCHGTAARINHKRLVKWIAPAPPQPTDVSGTLVTTALAGQDSHTLMVKRMDRRRTRQRPPPHCASVHPPHSQAPLSVGAAVCNYCGERRAPVVLLATVAPPIECPVHGDPVLIQARVVLQAGARFHGESGAVRVSDKLPFLENDLHAQLVRQMYAKGVNALFDIKSELTMNDECVTAVATGTGHYVTAMSPPPNLVVERPLDRRAVPAFDSLSAHLQTFHRQSSTLQPQTMIRPEETEHSGTSSSDSTDSDSSESTTSVDDFDATLHGSLDPQLERLYVGDNVSSEQADALLCGPTNESTVVTSTRPSASPLLGPPVFLAMVSLLEQEDSIHEKMQELWDGLVRRYGKSGSRVTISKVHVAPASDDTLMVLMIAAYQTPETAPTPAPTPMLPSFQTVPLSPSGTAGPRIPSVNHGTVEVVLVKESMSSRKVGGFIGFWHRLVLEALSMLRSRIRALGGDAGLNVDIQPLHVMHKPGHDQIYCLLKVSADVVQTRRIAHIHSVMSFNEF
ncbi:Uncharacterized protein family UPF0145 [Carpediemonas membranifera]|uniref:Uncharacterized protein family UPF0145 n=1 Tax=Carpediemonas membranifera TaxID=201153 RepID=A0A8J6E153_9EUKA|nr:Uncharacterized protein family UPF0145 [Carpediemonas membranifera]|eukprot:KAG9390187.1 Uncharacterized protein family UPF0145 [Carpediemonas membranifera]